MFTLEIEHPPTFNIVSSLKREGEPVSLVVDRSGEYAYWSCGFSLRTVRIEQNGSLRIVAERRLHVYPCGLALSDDYLYAACGDGGLLWGPSSNLEKLAPAPELTFVTNVAAEGERVVAVTSK